jgi:hypothetical protein
VKSALSPASKKARRFVLIGLTHAMLLAASSEVMAQVQPSPLDQARAVDREAGQRAIIGSPKFFEERKLELQNILSSLPRSGQTPQTAQQPPDVQNDPRYDVNLKAMLTSSVSGIHPFIFGGSRVDFPQIPDAVKLTGTLGGTCTGTLISKDAVLTAGHCVCDMTIATVFFGSDATKHQGETLIAGNTKPKTPCIKTANNKHVDPGNDFGIVWLKTSAKALPRPIADPNLVQHASGITVVGFGYADTTPIVIGEKMQADIPIVSHDCTGTTINMTDSDYYGCAASREMVAAVSSFAPVRKDTCDGDSGGPVYVTSNSGALLLAATTSRGVRGPGGCGNGANYGLIGADVITWIEGQGITVTVIN